MDIRDILDKNKKSVTMCGSVLRAGLSGFLGLTVSPRGKGGGEIPTSNYPGSGALMIPILF